MESVRGHARCVAEARAPWEDGRVRRMVSRMVRRTAHRHTRSRALRGPRRTVCWCKCADLVLYGRSVRACARVLRMPSTTEISPNLATSYSPSITSLDGGARGPGGPPDPVAPPPFAATTSKRHGSEALQ